MAKKNKNEKVKEEVVLVENSLETLNEAEKEETKPSPVSLISPAINVIKGLIDLVKGLIEAAKELNVAPFVFLIFVGLFSAYNISHPERKLK